LPAEPLQPTAQVLEVGTRAADDAWHYSDIDLEAPAGQKPAIYTRRDGTPYENITRRGLWRRLGHGMTVSCPRIPRPAGGLDGLGGAE